MAFSIAVAGKGGTGKTTLSALLVACLLRAGAKPVLAVDADPNSNLDESLGVKVDRTVVSTVDRIMKEKESRPAGLTMERLLQQRFAETLIEAAGFDLLVMGHGEGAGCYCAPNTLLKGLLDTLCANYPWVVMDNEAGLEHLSRRTTRNVDVLLIAAAPNPVAIRAARRILAMTRELDLGIGQSFLVLNRMTPGAPQAAEKIPPEITRAGELPYDPLVAEFSVQGRPLLELPADAPAVRAAGRILAAVTGRGPGKASVKNDR